MDISFPSTGRKSIENFFPSLNSDTGMSNPRLSLGSDIDGSFSLESMHDGRKSTETGTPPEFPSLSFESDQHSSSTSQAVVRKVDSPYMDLFGLRKYILFSQVNKKSHLVFTLFYSENTIFVFIVQSVENGNKVKNKVTYCNL